MEQSTTGQRQRAPRKDPRGLYRLPDVVHVTLDFLWVSEKYGWKTCGRPIAAGLGDQWRQFHFIVTGGMLTTGGNRGRAAYTRWRADSVYVDHSGLEGRSVKSLDSLIGALERGVGAELVKKGTDQEPPRVQILAGVIDLAPIRGR